MSLNHKRRIFRSARRGPALSLPSARVLLAAVGGTGAVLVAAWLLARPTLAPAQAPATGHLMAEAARVAVVDGTTLRLHDRVVKLDGVAAPARGAVCGAGATDCGAAAANALARLVEDRAVDCTLFGHDGGGRPLARCTARGQDLNRALVAAGWARADDPRLTVAETEARSAHRGMWAGPVAR